MEEEELGREEEELGWKDFYDMFAKEVEELCDMLGIYGYDIPKFTEEEEALLNKLCKSDAYFEHSLETFYWELYYLIVGLKKRSVTVGYQLMNIGACYELVTYVLLKTRKGTKTNIRNLVSKFIKTIANVSAIFNEVVRKERK